MEDDQTKPRRPGRRGFLKAGAAAGFASTAGIAHATLTCTPADDMQRQTEPVYYGMHQAGIVTPQQSHTYMAAFDVKTDSRDELVALLRAWTQAAARMTRGDTAAALTTPDNQSAPDSADMLGLGVSAMCRRKARCFRICRWQKTSCSACRAGSGARITGWRS